MSFARAWRDWAQSWQIAEAAMPRLSPPLVSRLAAVALMASAFSYARYLAWATRAPYDYLVLGLAVAAGLVSCRAQLSVQPTSLLVPIAHGALFVASVSFVARVVDLDPAAASMWIVALAVVVAASLGLSLRLWAMLLFSVNEAALLRRGRTAVHRGALVAQLRAIDEDGDALVSTRQGDVERDAVLAGSLLPSELRDLAPGTWLAIERARVIWQDGAWRIVDGCVHYVGADPDASSPPPLGEISAGIAAVAIYDSCAGVAAAVLVHIAGVAS